MTIYVLCVPGTSETHDAVGTLPPIGMTKLVTDLLPKKIGSHDVQCLSIPYISGYGDRASYLTSVKNGKSNLRQVIWALPEDSIIFIIGYSQGGTIGGDLTRDCALEGKRIVAYFGIADPRRNHADIVGPDPGGCGITGERVPWPQGHGAIYQFCAPGDIIASSDPKTDLFMEASKFTNHFWVGDTIGWIGYCLALLNNSDFQKQLRKEYGYKGVFGWLEFGTRLRKTIERGTQYLLSQVHVKYGEYKVKSDQTVHEYIANQIVIHALEEQK